MKDSLLFIENIQKQLCEKEEKIFSKNAFFSANTKGRLREEKSDIRSSFMRDRDRIIHSSSFRRLKDKAQVFLLSKNDMVRTRLAHTLEVAQVSRTIASSLNLNETLTEAVALGHDLGHTPFGHVGERALRDLSLKWFSKTGKDLESIDYLADYEGLTQTPLKGFRHNIQSLKVVDFLEKKGQGLNLTYEVREGILKHSKWGKSLRESKQGFKPSTLEAQIVRMSDRIAYLNHDLEDALRHKVISQENLPKESLKVLGETSSERITTAVLDMLDHYHKTETINLSNSVHDAMDELYNFLNANVYQSDKMQEESQKATFVVKELAEFYLANKSIVLEKTSDIAYSKEVVLEQRILDYIANMTDHFILQEFDSLLTPRNPLGSLF